MHGKIYVPIILPSPPFVNCAFFMNLRAGIASFLCKKAMHDTAAFQKASQSFAAAAAKAIIIIFAGGVYVGKNSAHGAECINFACKIYARSAV